MNKRHSQANSHKRDAFGHQHAGVGKFAGGQGGPMERTTLSQPVSDRLFSRGNKVHPMNTPTVSGPMRGGIRL